jgi:Raf kinase inhibitor-like YbhB/YbcL family protein
LALLCAATLALVAGFSRSGASGGPVAFEMRSSAFQPGAVIPTRHTCDGVDVSPALSWTDPPAGARSLALVVDDPDAPRGTWTHWLLWDLPADRRGLPEGVSRTTGGPEGSRQGTSDFRKAGYGGPCPPPGAAHRYFFRLLALDGPLDLPAGADRAAFDRALQKRRVLGTAELMGRYARAR